MKTPPRPQKGASLLLLSTFISAGVLLKSTLEERETPSYEPSNEALTLDVGEGLGALEEPPNRAFLGSNGGILADKNACIRTGGQYTGVWGPMVILWGWVFLMSEVPLHTLSRP